MESIGDDRALKALRDLEKSKIMLVKWETPLLRRLGYPLAPKADLLFLVPDEQVETARDIVEGHGLVNTKRSPSYVSEHACKAFRYEFGEQHHKFILVPLSWTGIEQIELSVVDVPLLPCSIWTVPVPSFCAAYLRIIMQEEAGSVIRLMATADLSSVLGYSMFDMSYDGSYMLTPEDEDLLDEGDRERMAEKDALEMENALSSIKEWKFTEQNEWARDMILQLVSGNLMYEDLLVKGKEDVLNEFQKLRV